MKNIGIVYALLAYFIWGIAPLYWAQVAHVDSLEIVAHRMLWSAILSLALLAMLRDFKHLKPVLRNPALVGRLGIAAILISINWGLYIWAITNGRIVEASLGYFIIPLVNVFLGKVFFQETLRAGQKLAITIAALGVAYLVFVHGKIPYVALMLAFSFGSYGAMKKSFELPAQQSIAIETSLLSLPALGYLLWLSQEHQLAFGNDIAADLILIMGGAFTITPLILFSAAAKRISLTALGMTQYLGPTLQLLIAVLVFKEAFAMDQQISFGLVWAALVIYSFDQINHRRRSKIAPMV